MNRAANLRALAREPFDVLIAGGGATGLGAALDAASRGYRTALVEARDFAGGTSSRSTKLIHGGVRYLQQGNVALVREALHERETLLRNAPHLVHELRFAVPCENFARHAYYWFGLKIYDALSGSGSFSRSRILSRDNLRTRFPALRGAFAGGFSYADAEFDDAGLAIALAQTAQQEGAALANYCAVERFLYDGARVSGAVVRDAASGDAFEIRARAVINAAGVFADAVRRLDDPQCAALLRFSRGSHIVVHASALRYPPDALLVPKTADGRVLFAVPWLGAVLIGTTEIAVDEPVHDPQPSEDEIAFILQTVNGYLERPLDRSEIAASFAGLRPLVRRSAVSTSRLSREHVVDVSKSGMVSIVGGKWTTYRKMAQDAVDAAVRTGGLPAAPCRTQTLAIFDAKPQIEALKQADPVLAQQLHPRLPYTKADAVYAIREQMARSPEDVLARRTRATFLNAEAARDCSALVQTMLESNR